MFARVKKTPYICTRFKTRSIYDGAIAQLVEQRTENPCVPGSIPGGTTKETANRLYINLLAVFYFLYSSAAAQR